MITVIGGSTNQAHYANSMAVFVCQKFQIEPTIEIKFKLMSTDINYGYCVSLDNNEHEITIKRTLKMREMLQTLAHELVHVKQYYNGELTQESNIDIEYWDRPSEIEAHGREIGLFLQWCEYEKVGHLAWTRHPNY